MQGAAGAGDKTYVDDVFHTQVFKSPNQNADYKVTNNIDNAGEGGFLWYKDRGGTSWHLNWDTARGSNKYIYSNSDSGESTSELLKSFDSDGYTIKTGTTLVDPARENVLWNFRRAPGFFDVVTWTGNGSTRTIPHNLGGVPGCIMVKNTSSVIDWTVWHRGAVESNATRTLCLNNNASASSNNTYFDNGSTPPTATNFTVHTSNRVNATGETYVAYVFAGGASTAATARSVAFSSTGSNDGAKSLTIASSSGTDFGSGDFTLECWFKDTRTSGETELDTIFAMSGYNGSSSENSFSVYTRQGGFRIFDRSGGSYIAMLNTINFFTQVGTWHHFAWTRSGSGTNNNTVWIDGSVHATFTGTRDYTAGQNFYIGGNNYDGTGTPNKYGFNGNISNVRITKGQAIYTTAFKPSTAPLTTTSQGATASNVKVICCNNSSITGSTVTSGTITSTNTPTASTISPFDDPEGFKFGKEEDQNIIKCGYYRTDSNEDAIPYLGWEAQWVLTKRIDGGSNNWMIYDSMRGLANSPDVLAETGASSALLEPNNSDAETNYRAIGVYPNGFVQDAFGANRDYIYIAIRRSDTLVGKLVEAGTDAFNVVYGNSSSTIPNFPSNFPVDMGIYKEPANSYDWYLHTRQTRGYAVRTNSQNAQGGNDGDATFDANTGWGKFGYNTDKASWMWTRHAGFDVVNYTGNGYETGSTGTGTFSHNLGRVPEMIWIKNRTSGGNTGDWMVGHKDLYGGSSPWNGYLVLNKAQQEFNDNHPFNNYTPTAYDFQLSNWDRVNGDASRYLTMLFASVDGICKVGSYTGSSSALTITTGFSPRFVIIKNRTNTGNNWTTGWFTFDTTRGWAAGNNDKRCRFNDTAAQSTEDWTDPTSTGFTINANSGNHLNNNGEGYIYYAHA